MSRVEAATGTDRLPWLSDEPKPTKARRRNGGAIAAMAIAAAVVGGAAFWFGMNGVETPAPPAPTPRKAVTIVKLPPAAPAQPQVELATPPEVEPIVAPPTPVIDQPPIVRRAPVRTAARPHRAEKAKAVEEAPKPAPPSALEPWPVRIVDGAAGRLVRVGAFSSVHQAKRGWWAIMKVNPTLKRLPALVVPVQSLRNGQVYYRLQMGTTSQAHSAVLCQRMRMIAEPCVVIGVSPQA